MISSEYDGNTCTDELDNDVVYLQEQYLQRGGRFEIVYMLVTSAHSTRSDSDDEVGQFEVVDVGTMGLYPVDEKDKDPREGSRRVIELRKMYLRREHRGQGLGREMLKRAIRVARDELGFDTMELDTAKPLTEAASLYESFGFQLEDMTGQVDTCRCEHKYRLRLVE